MKIKIWNTFNQDEGDAEERETSWDPEDQPDKPCYFEQSVEDEVREYAERDYDGSEHFDEQEYSARVGDETWHYVVTVEFEPVFSASRKKTG